MNPLVLLLLAGGAFALYAASKNAQAAPPPAPPPPPGAPPIDVVGPPPALPPEYTGVTPGSPGSEWEQSDPGYTNPPAGPTGPGGDWTQASWRSAPAQVRWYDGKPWVWTTRGWQRLY